MDVAAFFGKWLVDLTDAQASDGTVPPVAPVPPALTSQHRDGGPAWSDAIVICPWTIYRCCGDKRILERHFGAMKAFVDNIESRYPSLIRADAAVEHWQGYGDWLAFEEASAGDRRHGNTPKDLIGTAFFCYSAKLLARISGVLSNVSDLEHYEALAQRVRAAFRRRFVTADGRLVGETQTAYVLALYFGLLDRDEIGHAMTALVRDIEGRGMQLSTGMVGTTYLLHVLTNNGRLDLAYQLLLKTTPPSWLYPVTQGATTIWERWDGGTEARAAPDPHRAASINVRSVQSASGCTARLPDSIWTRTSRRHAMLIGVRVFNRARRVQRISRVEFRFAMRARRSIRCTAAMKSIGRSRADASCCMCASPPTVRRK